ncbi:hypothetical protein [Paenibacillus sp. FSL H7-0714]
MLSTYKVGILNLYGNLRDDFTLAEVVKDVHKHFFGIDEFVKA